MKPKYRFTPSLLGAWQDFVDAEQLWDEFYGGSDDPKVSLEEFEAKCEAELWDSINRVDRGPIEAADRGTCLNEVVDMLVEHRGVMKDGMSVEGLRNGDGSLYAVRARLNGFTFDFDYGLVMRLYEHFKGSTCQFRCEAGIDTSFGPVLLYGDADYIRMDKVRDLKTTTRYKYGKFEKGWQKELYPYALIEGGDLQSVSEFEYTVVALSIRANQPISGEVILERWDYSHDRAKVRLRAVSEALAAYLEANADRIVHPSRVLNEI